MTRLFGLGFALATVCMAMPGLVVQADEDSMRLNQWARLGNDGLVAGRVVVPGPADTVLVVPEATVTLTDRAGKVTRTEADEQGRFSFSQVSEGIYSLTATSEGIFACYALHLIDTKHEVAPLYPTAANVNVVAARVGGPTIKEASLRYMPTQAEQASASLQGLELAALANQVSGNLLRVSQSGGGMRGQIWMAGAAGGQLRGAANMNVFIFANGNEVGRGLTGDQGEFEITNVPPGQYTALAVGPAGMGVVGFELLSAIPAPVSSTAKAGSQLVAAQLEDAPANGLNLQPATLPAGGEVILSDEVIDEEIIEEELYVDGFGTPMGGGGFSGGGGGGGGGGFGGGFGGIGALAGIGAAVAIAASDDDDDGLIIPPPAASPVLP